MIIRQWRNSDTYTRYHAHTHIHTSQGRFSFTTKRTIGWIVWVRYQRPANFSRKSIARVTKEFPRKSVPEDSSQVQARVKKMTFPNDQWEKSKENECKIKTMRIRTRKYLCFVFQFWWDDQEEELFCSFQEKQPSPRLQFVVSYGQQFQEFVQHQKWASLQSNTHHHDKSHSSENTENETIEFSFYWGDTVIPFQVTKTTYIDKRIIRFQWKKNLFLHKRNSFWYKKTKSFRFVKAQLIKKQFFNKVFFFYIHHTQVECESLLWQCGHFQRRTDTYKEYQFKNKREC